MIKMRIIKLLIFVLLSWSTLAIAQVASSKKAGICFRIDDNQPMDRLKSFAEVFARYGYVFSFAMNVDLIQDEGYLQMIRDLVAKGNEFMDHTPDHSTVFFLADDANRYSGLPGVHHISGNKVCLSYKNLDPTPRSYEGRANIVDNKVFSLLPGGFQAANNVDFLGYYIFFPDLGDIYHLTKVYNYSLNDIDTIQIESFWSDSLSKQNYQNVRYHLMYITDCISPDESQLLLAGRTIELCEAKQLPRPTTWVQPGGYALFPNRSLIRRTYGEVYGYTAGTSTEGALKCYDEYDPYSDKRFGITWDDDLFPEITDAKTMILRVMDKIATHRIAVIPSHFNIYNNITWDAFLARIDSILAFAKKTNIPVNTLRYWSSALYDFSSQFRCQSNS